MNTIFLYKGIPASGKSTKAKEEMNKYPGRFKRINKVLLRLMIDWDKYSEKNEKFLLKVRDYITEISLVKGYDVIIDDTNFHPKHWESMCNIARSIGDITVTEIYCDVSLPEALKRNSLRETKVPEDVIEGMFNKYVKNKKIECRNVYFPKNTLVKEISNDKLDAVIFDIDGTLALANSRNIYDESQILFDDLNKDIAEMLMMYRVDCYQIIIVTGRKDSCKDNTETWLSVNGIHYDELFMRKVDDNREDSIIKEEIYINHILPKYNVHYVIDDRPRVCRMWRKHGITTFQLNHVDF